MTYPQPRQCTNSHRHILDNTCFLTPSSNLAALGRTLAALKAALATLLAQETTTQRRETVYTLAFSIIHLPHLPHPKVKGKKLTKQSNIPDPFFVLAAVAVLVGTGLAGARSTSVAGVGERRIAVGRRTGLVRDRSYMEICQRLLLFICLFARGDGEVECLWGLIVVACK